MEDDVRAALLTGPYGCGKSSVAAEMADLLEKGGARYAAVDLDWLAWGYAGEEEGAERRMMLANLTPVVGNYLAVGVRRFVLAGWFGNREELDELRAMLPMRLDVVRLELAWEEVERRLRADPTTGRLDDLREAAAQHAAGGGAGLEDHVVRNDRPLREVALDVLGRLGWS